MAFVFFIHTPKSKQSLVGTLCPFHLLCVRLSFVIPSEDVYQSSNSIYGSFLSYPTLVFSLASEHSGMKDEKVMNESH
jgi:hypothetical protein